MSTNPYYSAASSTSHTPQFISSDSRHQQSHWQQEYEAPNKSRGNFVEKFSPPSNKIYEPSARSNGSADGSRSNSPFQPWNNTEHRDSQQYSEAGSLPSYHDSPTHSTHDLENGELKGIRKSLDSGNKARVYLFIAMCSGMLLLFLFAALIWLGLGIIKKPLQYGVVNKGDFTVRPA